MQLSGEPLRGNTWDDRHVILLTAHRRENFGRVLIEICAAVRYLAQRYASSVYIVYPVHLNPHVRHPVNDILSGLPNVSLIEPLDYLSLVHLMKQSTLILTDSGGIQEEASGLRVPVLVMRDTTERPEGIETGVVRLVGTQRCRIITEAEKLLRDPAEHAAMATGTNPYGDWQSSQKNCLYSFKAVG
jgi:UDP-N-acetylglucosamine 2-epimerase (non-hydrolysing)